MANAWRCRCGIAAAAIAAADVSQHESEVQQEGINLAAG
jgi:hypothetical protein